jgi:hypothetical protein
VPKGDRGTGDRVNEDVTLLVRSEIHLRRPCFGDALTDAERVLATARAGGNAYVQFLALHQISKIRSATAPRENHGAPAPPVDILGGIHARRDPTLEVLLLSPAPNSSTPRSFAVPDR